MNRFAMIAVLALAACSDEGGKGDSGGSDTGTTPGALEVTGYDVACADGSVTLEATTSGPGNDGLVVMQETASTYAGGQNQEEAMLTSSGNKMSATLTVNDDPPGIFPSTPDDTSTFTCSGHFNDPDWMAYAFMAYDADGAIVDCLAGGYDAAGFVAGDYADVAVGTGASAEAEAFLANCVVGSASR